MSGAANREGGQDTEALDASAFGRYRLLRQLGRGGMAEVYLAETDGPLSPRRQVAIKRLLPAYATSKRYVQMLLDEAHIAGRIQHPNVVSLLDFGQVGAAHFLALEFVDGFDLASILRRVRAERRDLPLTLALHVSRCVARGLHAAHTLTDAAGRPMRVVHRDVSPHNVLVSRTGEVKLIDFGVAKAETNLTTTRTGIIKGKLQYMSPEQAQARPVDCRADVFSLGMTLYKMLVGHLPFSGSNEFQIYDEILRKRATPPSHHRADVTERVDALVLRALQKAADDRFQSADEMARVIDRALAELAPDFGSDEVAAFLADDLPGETSSPADANDDFRPVDEGSGAFAAATAWDAARIERLTRMEDPQGMVATVRAPIDPPPGTAATVIDEEPPGTLILAAPASGGNEGRSATDARPDVVAAVREPGTDAGDAGLAWWRPTRPGWAVLGMLGFLTAVLLALRFGGPEPTVEHVVVRRAGPNLGAVAAPATGPAAATVIAPVTLPAPPPAAAAETLPSAPEPARASASPSLPPDEALRPEVPGPAPPTATPPALRAYLTISTLPWAWVYLDGAKLNRHTPLVSHPVKPGRHRLRLETGDGRSHATEITLKPGQRLTISHAFD